MTVAPCYPQVSIVHHLLSWPEDRVPSCPTHKEPPGSPVPSLSLSLTPQVSPSGWLYVSISFQRLLGLDEPQEIIRSHAFILQMRIVAQRGEGPATRAQQTVARPISQKHTGLCVRWLCVLRVMISWQLLSSALSCPPSSWPRLLSCLPLCQLPS